MTHRTHHILNWLIALVWFINGFICKVLNLVPRHQEIVARIIGNEHSRTFTILIGLSEIVMALWILTGKWSQVNAITQIVVITVMNTLEFILVPDILLWGRLNALFALLFVILIYYNEFHLKRK